MSSNEMREQATQRKLLELAFAFHVGIEGEYGCPGETCPGVQRLVVALAALKGIGQREDVRSDGWQPIETAPKDGKRVLVWDGFDVMTAYHCLIGVSERGEDIYQWVTDQVCAEDPTHWRPLPDPPQEPA